MDIVEAAKPIEPDPGFTVQVHAPSDEEHKERMSPRIELTVTDPVVIEAIKRGYEGPSMKYELPVESNTKPSNLEVAEAQAAIIRARIGMVDPAENIPGSWDWAVARMEYKGETVYRTDEWFNQDAEVYKHENGDLFARIRSSSDEIGRYFKPSDEDKAVITWAIREASHE